jgi:tetratricopeptide (TPR) repeat protein
MVQHAWTAIVATMAIGAGATASELEAAREALRTGQYERCLKASRRAVAEGAYQTEWQALIVKSLLATGQYGKAAEDIDAVVRRSRPTVHVLKLAHTAYERNGQADQAELMLAVIYRIATTRRAEYMSSRDVVALGRALLLMGVEPRLVLDDFYERTLRKDPNCLGAYLAAGDLALSKQDFELAAEQYRKAKERFGDEPDVHCGMARAFYHSDRKVMLESLQAALHLNPRHTPALVLLAEHQIDGEDYDGAGRLLDRALAVNPWHPDAWAYRAVLAHLANEPNAVADSRANALKFWPDNPRVDYLIGRKLSQKYRFTEGAAYQRRALASDPNHLPAKIQLAQDLLRLGREDDGWTLADEVNRKDAYNVEAYNLVNLRDKLADFVTLAADGLVVRMDRAEAAVYGDRVMALLQEARSRLCEKYGIQLVEPVTVELFPNQQDFAVRTFGMPGGDGFLGVCFGDVITANSPRADRPSNWEATLWHEFCHVVTLNLTRNKMPRWLSEGISVYEELQRDPTWGQQMNPEYRRMILGGEMTPIGELSGAFLSPPSPLHLQFAYYESALAVDFFVQRAGFAALRTLLADLAEGTEINAAIAAHIGPLDEIEKEFEAFARNRAQALAPGIDWEQPERTQRDLSNADAVAKWLEAHPRSFAGLQMHANRLLAEERWDEAKAPLKKLISLYPEYVGEGNAYVALAEVHRRLDETDRELKALSELAERSADAVHAYNRLMELGVQEHDWERVRVNGLRYLAVYPMQGNVYQRLAKAFEALGRQADAIDAYRRLLLLDPGDPVEVNYRLARLLRDDDPAAAKRHLLDALADAPRFRQGHQLLLEMTATSAAASPEVSPPSAREAVQ